jgi:hypothetical protein
MIYEMLFQRDEPVLLHDVDTFHALKPKADRCSYYGHDYYTGAMDQFYTDYEEEIGTDQNVRYGLGKSIALLLSCRQLYHEAAGVLYGKNSFVVSRFCERHNDDDDLNANQDEYF